MDTFGISKKLHKQAEKNWLAYFFVRFLRQKAFKAPSRQSYFESLCTILQQWPTQVKSWHLEENCSFGELQRTQQVCIHFSALQHFHKYIYYCIDIHYRAAGSTAGKHCSPVAFSSRWKHYLATAAVALETWSLSLFYPHSSPLASLSALLLAIRIKPAAGLAVLKCSLQLNTFKQQCFFKLHALHIRNHAPGSCASKSLHYGYYTDEWLQNPCLSALQIQM